MGNAVLVLIICSFAAVAPYQSFTTNDSFSNITGLRRPTLSNDLARYSRYLPVHKLDNSTKHKKHKSHEKPSRRSYDDQAAQVHMSVPQVVQDEGYPAETYTVETEDGYRLTVHRIPWGVKSPRLTVRSKPVAFLMHGLFASSADYILNGPEHSLAYLLADAGYDVWLGNARGNRYSRTHRSLLPGTAAFWDFSFHEIGYYDLPAMIDFVLNMTEQRRLYYVGHSQGTTVFHIMCSEHPEYNDKVIVSVNLAPVVYMKHITSPFFNILAMFGNAVSLLLDVIGIGEMRPNSDLLKNLGSVVCRGMNIAPFLCTTPRFIISGFSLENFNTSRIPFYSGHSPAGCATKQIIHFLQLHVSGKFRYFDNGVMENLVQYNSVYPPSYKLANVQAPVILVYSLNDWLSHEQDVEQLYSELKNARKFLVADPRFTHADYIYGLNMRAIVNDPVIKMLKEYHCTGN